MTLMRSLPHKWRSSAARAVHARVSPSWNPCVNGRPSLPLSLEAQSLPSFEPRLTPEVKGCSEFHLGIGRVIDVLRDSYPRMFTARPDMSIYAPSIKFYHAYDTSRPTLSGIDAYTRLFDAMRLTRYTAVADAELTYRLHVVDDTIRVRWAASLWLRLPLTPLVGGKASPLYVDGISVYLLDDAARVFEHRLEFVEVTHNGVPIAPDSNLMPWARYDQQRPQEPQVASNGFCTRAE
ncbi:hypothetical protein AB1Y20_019441 [Prymnesium parvum]|uniref:Uncharacterized protein n=1 Tax=Prymnesium parvum TaxID=97485 RepID=A0AB34JR70_PRYPA|mmetsp:Transcript_45262/g.112517  ORF Transcript_45262/g.112517 Transcript_45262/m.112517 type:complete len:236 (+) Transcript_45262:50-757(+)